MCWLSGLFFIAHGSRVSYCRQTDRLFQLLFHLGNVPRIRGAMKKILQVFTGAGVIFLLHECHSQKIFKLGILMCRINLQSLARAFFRIRQVAQIVIGVAVIEPRIRKVNRIQVHYGCGKICRLLPFRSRIRSARSDPVKCQRCCSNTPSATKPALCWSK